MKDFRDLKVWGKAHSLTLQIYSSTKQLPKEELYGLVSQMRRSCSSIPTNIAEGCGRNSDAQFAQFLNIASGSASELEYQILLSKELNFISQLEYDSLNSQITEIKKMLVSLARKVKS